MASSFNKHRNLRARLEPQLLSDLYIFQHVVHSGGVGAAGRKMGVSQGAVSQRITRLESRLGFALFQRSHEGLTLTPKGKPLAEAVRGAMEQLLRALGELQPENGLDIRVNCTPSLATEWLVPALDEFYETHPDLNLIIYADQAPLSARRVGVDPFDVGIRYAPHSLSDFIEFACIAEEVVPVCAPGYFEDPKRSIVRLHDETPWTDAAPDEEWHDWERDGGVMPNRVARDQGFNLATLAYDAAAAGQGVAMGRLVLARERLESCSLVAANERIVAGAQYRIVAAATPAKRSAAMQFVEWATQHLSEAQIAARTKIKASNAQSKPNR